MAGKTPEAAVIGWRLEEQQPGGSAGFSWEGGPGVREDLPSLLGDWLSAPRPGGGDRGPEARAGSLPPGPGIGTDSHGSRVQNGPGKDTFHQNPPTLSGGGRGLCSTRP